MFKLKNKIQVKGLDEMPSLNQQNVSVGIIKFTQSLQSPPVCTEMLTHLCFV